MSYKKEAIAELIPIIKKAGFVVYVAKSGTYGFYTDKAGKKLISFQGEFCGLVFSTNYQSLSGSGAGSGCRITHDPIIPTVEDIKSFYNGPLWYGNCLTRRNIEGITGPTTLKQCLKNYQWSSKYKRA
jgi:hypothetical protein